MEVKVASAVFATDQGLGYLAKSFFDEGLITHPVVVKHGSRENWHKQWYPRAPYCVAPKWLTQVKYAETFLAAKVALFFETPFEWKLLDFCRERGIKTALMPMYECMPETLPAKPDLFVNPSEIDQEYYSDGVRLNVPVPKHVTWRKRTIVKTFVHNAGNGGLRGRNGTLEFLECLRHVKSPAKFILRTQTPLPEVAERMLAKDGRVEVREGCFPQETLWGEGDAFVFPDKFNGLSMPLQEARAAGMLVIATNRYPANYWLPREPLIPTVGKVQARVSARCNSFSESIVEPKDLAEVIDAWYGRDVSSYSESGREWGHANSWDLLRPRWVELLETLGRSG